MIVFLINLACTWFMVGLIWIIQIVHYPLFRSVGITEFMTYHESHKILISPVVGVVMIFELVTTLILIFQTPKGIPIWTVTVSIILFRQDCNKIRHVHTRKDMIRHTAPLSSTYLKALSYFA